MDVELSFKDRLLLSPGGQWMDRNRKWVLNILGALLLVFLWASVNSAASSEVGEAQTVRNRLKEWKEKLDDEAAFRRLQQALAAAPDLGRALQAEIAQWLLVAGRVDEAEKMAQGPLKGLREVAPLHAEFASISFLVAKKRYQQALEQSVSLKEKMEEQQSVLYGKNLLRIAFLQKKVENGAGEMASWREFEGFAEKEKTLAELTLKGLGDQTIRFQTYVDQRKANF